MMEIFDLILKRRSIRKFKQKKIKEEKILKCIEAGRLAPSAGNLQPLEFIYVMKNLDTIFKHTKWAFHLPDGTPKKHERPVAYIIIISSSNTKYDVGFAAENIVLAALNQGIASCVLGLINEKQLAKKLNVPNKYNIELAIALGYAAQKSIIEYFKGDIRYYIDKKGIIHVPKKINIIHKERKK